MTKLIGIAIIALLAFCGWELFLYWDKISTEKDNQRKETAAAIVSEEQLPGLPEKLRLSWEAAKRLGPTGVKNWLNTYGHAVEDPRKAWMQLDYVLSVSRENVAEAKRVFTEVKERTPTNSPVWPRIEKLGKTYD